MLSILSFKFKFLFSAKLILFKFLFINNFVDNFLSLLGSIIKIILFHSLYLNIFDISILFELFSSFEIIILSGLINLSDIICPPIFIFTKLMLVLPGNTLKYSSIKFLSKFIQKTKEHPFSKVGKSVLRLQDDLFNFRLNSLL